MRMGLVLDSSVVVTTERQELPISTLLEALQKQHNITEIVLSAISVVELEHGIYRAQSSEQAAKRRRHLDTVFAALESPATSPQPAPPPIQRLVKHTRPQTLREALHRARR
jgi:predicted nucleic acid-binding protein